MRIAIDAMGGDYAPKAHVEGAIAAVSRWPEVEIILVGDEKQITSHLTTSHDRIEIYHTTEVIETDEDPTRAVRSKKDSSLVVGAQLVKEGRADSFISAGNTGALMVAGLLIIGRIKGVERPGLSPVIPTLDNKGVLVLDVGANIDAKPQHLLQYGVMGSMYVKDVLGVENPRVALLNIGSEENKGNDLTKEAYALLKEAPINFIGNIEARDLLEGVCDVLVCDGFSGNVLLKTTEGVAGSMFSKLKEIFTSSFTNKIAAGILKSSLVEFKNQMDYKEYGGSPLLGLKGACFKAHGSSDARAIVNAIDKARIFHQQGVITKLSESFNERE